MKHTVGLPISKWYRAYARTASLALVGALVAGLLGTTPPAAAHDDDDPTPQVGGTCPGPLSPIMTNVRLVANVVAGATDDPCIRFGTNNIKVEMEGFTIDMRAAGGARAFDTNLKTNVRIEGPGQVLTNYTTVTAPAGVDDVTAVRAIHVNGGGNVRVRDVTVRNAMSNAMLDPLGTAPCVSALDRVGEGILVQGAGGAKLHDNTVECYLIGMHVKDSNPQGGGADMIVHNIVRQNASDLLENAGIRLQNSSGWSVHKNELTMNGSALFPFDAPAIRLMDGASGNQIVKNTADSNFGAGISVTDALSVGNRVAGNHAILNAVESDLNDGSGPGLNDWRRNNVCKVESGFVPADVCNPEEQ